jgi:hypothetical protein
MISSLNQRETGYLTNAGELINENMVTLMGTIQKRVGGCECIAIDLIIYHALLWITQHLRLTSTR